MHWVTVYSRHLSLLLFSVCLCYFEDFGFVILLMVHSLWFHLCFSVADRNVLLHPDVRFTDPAATLKAEHSVSVASPCQGPQSKSEFCVCCPPRFRIRCISLCRTEDCVSVVQISGDLVRASGLEPASGSHSAWLHQFLCLGKINFFFSLLWLHLWSVFSLLPTTFVCVWYPQPAGAVLGWSEGFGKVATVWTGANYQSVAGSKLWRVADLSL